MTDSTYRCGPDPFGHLMMSGSLGISGCINHVPDDANDGRKLNIWHIDGLLSLTDNLDDEAEYCC